MTDQVNTAPMPNQRVNDPDLKSVLDILKRDILLSMNCHAIATVTSFDSTKQRVQASINYKKTFLQPSPNNSIGYTPQYVSYPALVDVPIYILSGGPCALTFPIAAGDTCSILFNDRDMDNWLASGQVGPLASSRMHSFSDGVALIGLRAIPNALETYDTVRALLFNGRTMVGVGPDKVLVNNAAGQSLGSLLNDLSTELTNLTTALIAAFGAPTPSPGNPINPAAVTAITTIQTQLNLIQTEFGGLLE